MKKLKTTLVLALGFIAMCFTAITINKVSASKQATADSLTNLGEVSVTEVSSYDPCYGNTNAFFMMKLSGSDYPSENGASSVEKYKSQMSMFDHNFGGNLRLFNVSGSEINYGNDYISLYANQHTLGSYFSVWLSGMSDAKSAVIKKGLKIPSYALLKGETSSSTYGYYTIDKDYSCTNTNQSSARTNVVTPWEFSEYNARNVSISQIKSFVDTSNESLAFYLSGGGVDYPDADGQGNFRFETSTFSTIAPNFKEKVHIYDNNSNELTYDIFDIVIDKWTYHPFIAFGLTNLGNATKLIVDEGLLLPSYARFKNETESDVYDGFICNNTLSLSIDDSVERVFPNQIEWLPKIDVIGELTLKSLHTQNPHGNHNEFVTFCFNEKTDFESTSKKWDVSQYSLLENFSEKIEIYNVLNNKINNNVIDVWYGFGGVSNSINIMIDSLSLAGKEANKIIIHDEIKFPSLALHDKEYSSETCGYYVLKGEYELTAPENISHIGGADNVWEFPKCDVEYYDENNQLLSELNDKAECGTIYTLKDPIAKVGYDASWEVIEPAGLTILENKITVPSSQMTIKFKAHYESACSIEYYDEDDNIISEYSTYVACGASYTLEPVISKRGHNASWVVLEPSGVSIVNNTIVAPSVGVVIKFKAHYEPRVYTLSFDIDGISPIQITYGQTIGELPTIPAQVGKTAHWEIDGELINDSTIYNYDENKTANAIYLDKICIITLNTMGGSTLENIEVIYGNKISNLPTPTKEGYFFDGWFVDEACLTKFNVAQTIEDDLTLYASWIVKCVVTFNTDGGSLIDSVIVGKGQIIDRPNDPTKAGYEFVNWTLNGQEFDFNTPINSDITLVANWKFVEAPISPEEPVKEEPINGGLIAGIVAGSVVAAGGLGVLVFLLLKKKKVS